MRRGGNGEEARVEGGTFEKGVRKSGGVGVGGMQVWYPTSWRGARATTFLSADHRSLGYIPDSHMMMDNQSPVLQRLLKQSLMSSHDGLGLTSQDFAHPVVSHCVIGMLCNPSTNQQLCVHCPNKELAFNLNSFTFKNLAFCGN